MRVSYCTYFDRNYLIKGMAMIQSLIAHDHEENPIFVVCLDELTQVLLSELNYPRVTLIPLHAIEYHDMSLIEAKNNRSLVEYYWTLTPSIILWIFNHYPDSDNLIYLDADLYFYSSPKPIFDHFTHHHVLIHEHRFSDHLLQLEEHGKYNVGLLGFRRSFESLTVLKSWRNQCNAWCYRRIEDGKFGDQLYLNDWPQTFNGIYVIQDIGAGVAPWNHDQYDFDILADGQIVINQIPIIFYHFHSLTFCTPELIIPVNLSYSLREDILRLCFIPYITKLYQNYVTLQNILPDFPFGLFDDQILTQRHTFIARKNLESEIANWSIPQIKHILSLDNGWVCFGSHQFIHLSKSKLLNLLLKLSYQFLNSNQLDDAQSSCLRLIDIDNECSDAYYILAMIYWRKQNSEQAKLYVKKALTINSDHSDANTLIAHIQSITTLNHNGEDLFQKGKFEQAEALFNEIIRLDSQFGTAYNNLAIIAWKAQDPDKAITYLLKSIDCDPNNSLPVKNLFAIYRKQGLITKARDTCLKFLIQYPNHTEVIQAWSSLKDSEQSKKIIDFLPAQPSNYSVSILISVYSAAEFIQECIENLMAQTIWPELHLIFIDAASPDNEKMIINSYQTKYDNITYIRTKDRIGIYPAWNIGIKHALGKYIMPMSTNDKLNNNACEVLSTELDKNSKIMLVYGNTMLTHYPHETFDNNSVFRICQWPDYSFEDHLHRCLIGPHPMWRKSIHQEIGYFDERYVADGDQEFFLRIGEAYPIKHIEKITGLQWSNPDSESLSGRGDTPFLEYKYIQSIFKNKYNYQRLS